MTRPRFIVHAYASWSAVAAGRRAIDTTLDDLDAAIRLRDSCPYPIVDIIRRDDTGGRVIAERRIPWPDPWSA